MAVTAASALLVSITGGASATASAAASTTVNASADTTYTQVTQDGDNSARTTLATCPSLCDGNSSGERMAVVGFTVAGLPAGASNITARLELYSWTAFASTTTSVHKASGGAGGTGTWASKPTLGTALDTNTAVTKGYNAWNVSSTVKGNGAVTFAVRQSTRNTRVYWGSKENTNTAARPRLVISYTAPSPTPTPTASPTPTPTPSPGPGWRLVWSDDFDGTALNTAKWRARDSYVDYDRACITSRAKNVFVANGSLTLRVHKENHTCGGATRPYTTGYVDTIGKASFAYGRFEARIKSPNGPANSRGLWPAFWMRPDDGGNGEIDVTELPGGASYYKAATAAIFRDYKPTKNDFRYTFPTGHPGDGFHTYTTEWEPGVIRWYVDGREIWRRDGDTTSWLEETFGADDTYKRKFHLRLNFQVGGWLGDPDASTTFPADFVVDHVRVWQR
ncbi:family 16 glycosylhydrolase [Nonomuraea cavernae]|uniref:family 16 glycosylhydrolase n=1 Tax=Nonomuraea cavernae TaxID=2045107 RepID=UPI0033D58E8C